MAITEFLDDVAEAAHDAYESRDDIGAIKAEVYLVTRIWDGDRIGDGTPVETKVRMLPTPHIVDHSHNLRLMTGGAIKQGDLVLKGVSKVNYPNEAQVDCSVSNKVTEKFYDIGGYLYSVIHVKSPYHSWDIHVRRTSDQTRY